MGIVLTPELQGILQGINAANDYIKCPRFLLRHTQDGNAALLLASIFNWYKVKGYQPFYKFREPCKHDAYKEGDSWVEELCIGVKYVDSILKEYGQKVNVNTERDPDALFWYWVDNSRLTRYELNLVKYLALAANDTEIQNYVVAPKGTTYLPEKELLVNTTITNNINNTNTKGSDGLGFTDNGLTVQGVKDTQHLKTEEKQSNPPSSAAPPLNYGSRIPKFGQLSLDYFEVQELLKVHPDAVLDLTASTKHTFEELGRTYGIEKVKEVAKWLGESRASQYLPKVVNFIQAEQFAGDLNSMITAKQFAPPKAPSQKTPQHPLTKGPQPKLII